MRNSEDEDRTVFCGNLSEAVTDSILYELFNQAGPVESVRRPKDPSGRPKTFAFILYKHECSVPYAIELFTGTKLFNRNINLNSRSSLSHIPVLDTHLTEFSNPWNQHLRTFGGSNPIGPQEASSNYQRHESSRFREHGSRHSHDSDSGHNSGSFRERERRSNWDRERVRGHRHSGSHSESSSRRSHSSKDDEPSSWSEFNALKGRGSLSNGHFRNDLQVPLDHRRDSNPSLQPAIPDFNLLLQMGQQMLIPGMGLPGMMPVSMPMMGLGPSLGGSNMFPSMQGGMSGGERDPSDKDRARRDHNERRGDRRDHPYERKSHERHDDHRRHDRGYSSSRSSHERERRDRRSR